MFSITEEYLGVLMMSKVYVLTEVYEGDQVLRESNILGVFLNETSAQRTMLEHIERDEYGFIKDNGTQEQRDSYFESNFKDGFVAYSVEGFEVVN